MEMKPRCWTCSKKEEKKRSNTIAKKFQMKSLFFFFLLTQLRRIDRPGPIILVSFPDCQGFVKQWNSSSILAGLVGEMQVFPKAASRLTISARWLDLCLLGKFRKPDPRAESFTTHRTGLSLRTTWSTIFVQLFYMDIPYPLYFFSLRFYNSVCCTRGVRAERKINVLLEEETRNPSPPYRLHPYSIEH